MNSRGQNGRLWLFATHFMSVCERKRKKERKRKMKRRKGEERRRK